jgi:hypothetical protein
MTERTERTEGCSVPPWRAISSLSVFSVFSVFSVLSAFSSLHAQAVRVSGRVLTADSVPVPGTRVVLHQVGQRKQGPIDSIRADRRGRFSFGLPPDTSAFYLASARYAGIEYFSSPLPTNPATPDSGARIVVYDTSSAAPVTLETRHLVVTRPGEDGSRGILDLIILRNSSHLTRIAPDTLRPSWSVPLPRGTEGLEVSEGDVSPDAVARRGDSLMITAPLAPGQRELTIQYRVPSGRRVLELPISGRGVTVNVLIEEREVKLVSAGLALADSQVIQGRSFRRWTGTLSAGIIRIILPSAGQAPSRLLAALVAAFGLGLAGAGWYLYSQRLKQPAPVPNANLVDAIAALDARYQGREAETPAEEWSSYQRERARLKADLQSSLAAGGGNR